MEGGLIPPRQKTYESKEEEIHSEENAYDEIQNACGSIFT